MTHEFEDIEIPAPPNQITVAELEDVIQKIADKRKEIEAADAITTALNKELMSFKAKAVAYLKELGKDDYRSDIATISISQKWRVNMPKDDAAKSALFGYLKDKGVYDHYATVNSASLNAYYMAEWESAKKDGEGMTFSIPGIEAPKMFEDLGFRKR